MIFPVYALLNRAAFVSALTKTTLATMATCSSSGNLSSMPLIGLGTLDIPRENVGDAIHSALLHGYRRIDCAPVYFNEDAIGDALANEIASGVVKREDLFVVSKLASPFHQKQHVEMALRKTLTDLRLDYLDLYLIHWPVAFHYVPIDPNKRGWDNEDIDDSDGGNNIDPNVSIHETWSGMQELLSKGLVKAIGVSNFPVALLHELLSTAAVPPAVNQVEAHPYLQQSKLLEYCHKRGVGFQAYSPLGTAGYKEENEPTLLQDPILRDIAKRHNATVAQVCLSWAMLRNTSVVAKSASSQHQQENYLTSPLPLTSDDLKQISLLERGHRFFRPEDWWGSMGMAVFD